MKKMEKGNKNREKREKRVSKKWSKKICLRHTLSIFLGRENLTNILNGGGGGKTKISI